MKDKLTDLPFDQEPVEPEPVTFSLAVCKDCGSEKLVDSSGFCDECSYLAQETTVGDWDLDAERSLEARMFDPEAQADLRLHEYLFPNGYGR